MAAFEVDVEGVTYDVDAPDENTAWTWANQTHRQQAEPAVPPAPTSQSKGIGISDIGRWMAQPYKDLGNLVTEVPATLATGMGSMLAGNVMGAASDLYSSATGQPRGGDNVRKGIMKDFTYQPRSQIAKEALGKLSEGMESNVGKLIQGLPIAGQELPMIARAAKQGIPAAAELLSAKLSAPSERVMQVARQNPELVEAAKNARALNLSVDPGQVNPTFKNRVVTGFARPEIVDLKASEINLPRIKNILRQEAGIEGNTLTTQAFEDARSVIARPYETVRNVGQLSPNTNLAATLRASAPKPITGLEKQVKEGTRVVNEVADAIADGRMTADDAVDAIRGYRSQAKNWHKIAEKGDAKRNPVEIAKAYQKVADTLEDYITSNLPEGSKLLDDFVSARQKLAQNYTVERLVNTESGLPELANFNSASMATAPLSGSLATLKNVYSNFPEALQSLNKYGGSMPKTISRANVGGTTGATAAMASGVSPGLGAILGSVTGLVGGRQAANLAVSPAYQAKNLVPNVPGPRRTLPQGFKLSPQAIPQLNLPVKEQPLSIPEAPPLIPGSWRRPLSDQPKQSPLPVLPDDLLTVAERYAGTDMPIGLIEGGGPATQKIPFPTLPPVTRGMLSLADDARPIPDTKRLATRHDVPTMEFMLKAEVLTSDPQAQALITTATKAISPAVKNKALAELKKYGINNIDEAKMLQNLYEGGSGNTRLPIEKTRGLLD